MAKINYSKVEEALNSGLIKMKIDDLDKIAEISQNIGRPELRKLAEAAIGAAVKKNLDRKAALFVLKRGSKKHTKDEFYEEFNLSHDEFCDLLEKGKGLTEADWAKLSLIKNKIQIAKDNLMKSHPEMQDEKVVEQNVKDQKNARIHVKNTWLPLK